MATKVEPGDRKGHWLVTVTVGSRDTRKRRKITLCPPSCRDACSRRHKVRVESKNAAAAEARKIEARLERSYTTRTVADVANRWIELREEDDAEPLSRNTLFNYRNAIKNDIIPAFGKRDVADITVADVEDWVRNYSRIKKPATGERALVVIRHVLERARYEGLISLNPAQGIKRPRRPPVPVRMPTEDQHRALLAALEEHAELWLRGFVVLSANLGTRRGELAALQWRHIDRERQEVIVEQSVDRWGAIKPTKTGITARVAATPAAWSMIGELAVEHVKNARETTGVDHRFPPDDDFVFHGQRLGEPRKIDAISRALARFQDSHEELDRIPLHQFRHRFGSKIAEGFGAEEAGKRLRHASGSRTAEEFYIHATEADDAGRAVLEAIEL